MSIKRVGIATIALVVLPHLLVGAQRLKPGEYTIYGYGTAPCGSWTSESAESARTKTPSIPHVAQRAWILGFVSGVGWTERLRLRETDSDALWAWVDTYCQQNPLETLATASAQLVLELQVS